MRSLLIALVAMFALNATALITTFNSNSKDNLGAVQHYDKVFISVIATTGLPKGAVAVLDATADDGMSITSSTATEVQPFCVTAQVFASGSKGLCQVYGYTDSLLFNGGQGSTSLGAAIAGGPLYYDTSTSGYAGKVYGIATGTKIGIALDASAASGSVEAFIRLL